METYVSLRRYKQGGNGYYGNQFEESPNNSKTPITQEIIAQMNGMSVDTLQNYKMLADMIPEIDDIKVLFIIIAF